jgi:DNA primase
MVVLAKMPYIDFAKLKAEIDMGAVLSMLGVANLKKQGEQLRGCCPIHGGTGDREFVVTPAKQAYYCFGCKSGGDIIKLVAGVNKCSQQQAAFQLARHFSIGNSPASGNSSAERNSTLPVNGTVPGNNSPQPQPALQALDYLQTAFEGRESLEVTPETLMAFGAGFAPKGTVRGRLAIPLHDAAGTLVAYCGRRLRDDGSPLLTFHSSFDPRAVLFNANRIEPAPLFLARDPLAVLCAFENGVTNVIAVLTDDISVGQLQILIALMEAKSIPSVEIF